MSENIIRSDKIFKIIVYYDEQLALMDQLDAIWYENKLWIVPAWFGYLDEEYRTPVRIIGLGTLQYEKAEGSQMVDYSLSVLLPRAVAEGRDPSPARYGLAVIEDPDYLRYPVASVHQASPHPQLENLR